MFMFESSGISGYKMEAGQKITIKNTSYWESVTEGSKAFVSNVSNYVLLTYNYTWTIYYQQIIRINSLI